MVEQQDYGKKPYVIDIEEWSRRNTSYRRTVWTGEKMQVILMTIPPQEEAGLEIHKDIDQFIFIEDGQGLCQMGPEKDQLDFERVFEKNDAVLIPANTWHNIINTGSEPLKLYTIYAGPEYKEGTVHETKEEMGGLPGIN